MKLTIKTLQQFTFKLDIDEAKTVRELKEQIDHDHGKDYPIAHQKLIYNGKILADESKLAEYDIDEKKFVVLMITRPPPPKVQPPPATAEKTSSSSTTPKKEEASKQKSKLDDKRQSKPATGPTTTTTTTTSSTTTSQPSSSPVPGGAAAAAAATNPASTNPATPTNLSTATTTTTTSSLQNAPRATLPTAGRTAVSHGGQEQSFMSSRLASIMNQPQFRHLQELIQQSPHLISPTIEGLASTDPEMYSFISENPDIFVSALNQSPMSLNLSPSSRGSGAGQQQSDQGMRELQQGVRNLASGGRQQVETINVSERDREAIERLKELGFTEIQAYQAYIACDRDEQLAANLLFQMEQ